MMADAAFLLVGSLTGALSFALLRWNAGLYLRGGLAQAVVAQVARFAGVAAVLTVAAQFGALPLLLCALGFLIARPFVTRLVVARP